MPDLMRYRRFRENDDDPPFQPQMTTPLPLPGEYIVLQLNPAAMARHLGKPELIRELEKLETKKYLAVVSHVSATPHSALANGLTLTCSLFRRLLVLRGPVAAETLAYGSCSPIL